MCMFAKGSMGRNFLRQVPNKNFLRFTVPNPMLKILPSIQKRKKKTTHEDVSEVLA